MSPLRTEGLLDRLDRVDASFDALDFLPLLALVAPESVVAARRIVRSYETQLANTRLILREVIRSIERTNHITPR